MYQFNFYKLKDGNVLSRGYKIKLLKKYSKNILCNNMNTFLENEAKFFYYYLKHSHEKNFQ